MKRSYIYLTEDPEERIKKKSVEVVSEGLTAKDFLEMMKDTNSVS